MSPKLRTYNESVFILIKNKLYNLTIWELQNFFLTFSKSLSWFIFSWKYGKEWDYGFFYNMLNKKFNDMLKFYSNKDNVVQYDKSRKRIVKDFVEILQYIKQLQEDNFLKKDWKNFRKKYPRFFDIAETKMKNGLYELKSKYNNNKVNKEFKELLEKEEKEKQLIKHKLFESIEKNIEQWWD